MGTILPLLGIIVGVVLAVFGGAMLRLILQELRSRQAIEATIGARTERADLVRGAAIALVPALGGATLALASLSALLA